MESKTYDQQSEAGQGHKYPATSYKGYIARLPGCTHRFMKLKQHKAKLVRNSDITKSPTLIDALRTPRD